jgi:hypothetical protein
MERSFNYAIVQLEANPSRGELLNVGIVVFDDQSVDVYPAKNLEKIRAISAALDAQVVVQAIDNLKFADKILQLEGIKSPEEKREALMQFSPLKLSCLGRFCAEGTTSYDQEVKRLVTQLVDPEPAARRTLAKPRSRLLSSIRSAFKAERILASKEESIDSHRVVLNEQLAEGLNADMLLKNGAMHVMQAVDASHSERARSAIQEIGISALVFEQARIRFGQYETRPRLVYTANSTLEKLIEPALKVAEHQGAQLINWESKDDRTRFVLEISSLAEPNTPQKRVNFRSVHVSTHEVRKLN